MTAEVNVTHMTSLRVRLAQLRMPSSVMVLLTCLAIIGAAVVAIPHHRARHDQALTTAANPATPGAYTGLGFDQCSAPSQAAMDAWLKSPYRAVGIYISGYSRGCLSQPNLTATWVATQLAKGWHLLPITFGPQASCQPRFPRYGTDLRINPNPANDYAAARTMGSNEANKTAAVAANLGLSRGSTMFYDLEGFDSTNTACRESALRFLSAWTDRVHQLGFASGVYSSAGSGIAMLDQARLARPANVSLPDQIWIARYDGKANTSATDYLSDAGWQGARIKQYQGGHNETYGGVTINIDNDYLALGAAPVSGPPAPKVAPAETHCGGVNVNLSSYVPLKAPTGSYVPAPAEVIALKCLLRERFGYRGNVKGTWGGALTTSVRSFRHAHGMRAAGPWSVRNWLQLFATGKHPTVRMGSANSAVRDLQRALNAAVHAGSSVNGVFDASTQAALKSYQAKVGVPSTGVAASMTWAALAAGRF